MYGHIDIYGATVSGVDHLDDAIDQMVDSEFGKVHLTTGSKTRQKRLDEIVDKLEGLVDEGQMDKVKRKSKDLARVVAKIQKKDDADFEPSARLQAFVDYSVDGDEQKLFQVLGKTVEGDATNSASGATDIARSAWESAETMAEHPFGPGAYTTPGGEFVAQGFLVPASPRYVDYGPGSGGDTYITNNYYYDDRGRKVQGLRPGGSRPGDVVSTHPGSGGPRTRPTTDKELPGSGLRGSNPLRGAGRTRPETEISSSGGRVGRTRPSETHSPRTRPETETRVPSHPGSGGRTRPSTSSSSATPRSGLTSSILSNVGLGGSRGAGTLKPGPSIASPMPMVPRGGRGGNVAAGPSTLGGSTGRTWGKAPSSGLKATSAMASSSGSSSTRAPGGGMGMGLRGGGLGGSAATRAPSGGGKGLGLRSGGLGRSTGLGGGGAGGGKSKFGAMEGAMEFLDNLSDPSFWGGEDFGAIEREDLFDEDYGDVGLLDFDLVDVYADDEDDEDDEVFGDTGILDFDLVSVYADDEDDDDDEDDILEVLAKTHFEAPAEVPSRGLRAPVPAPSRPGRGPVAGVPKR